MSVCVIGAGISGLSTAVCIQERDPSIKVTITTDKITPNTLSDIPAGVWKPYLVPDPRKDLVKRWGALTFQRIQQLWQQNAKDFGVNLISTYDFCHEKPKPELYYWKDIVFGFHSLSEAEIQRLGYSFRYGFQYTTFCLQPSKYLPYLLKQFEKNGGTVVQRKLNSIGQVVEDFDVIVNCSGLGAYELMNDKECYPVRGQVYRVDAPFMKHCYFFGEDFYVLPNHDSVVLGGTHQVGDWDTNVRKTDSEYIWNNLINYLPCLKEAKILKEVVGLRPARQSIRLESEIQTVVGKNIPVVHNYGHGGSGVTLFYGCAMDAADLTVKALKQTRAKL